MCDKMVFRKFMKFYLRKQLNNTTKLNFPQNIIKDSNSTFLQNIVVKWLALLLHIREVSSSNFGHRSVIPIEGFLSFYSVPPGECWTSALKLGHNCLLPNPISLFPYHPPL
jgi:hypothetical protein